MNPGPWTHIVLIAVLMLFPSKSSWAADGRPAPETGGRRAMESAGPVHSAVAGEHHAAMNQEMPGQDAAGEPHGGAGAAHDHGQAPKPPEASTTEHDHMAVQPSATAPGADAAVVDVVEKLGGHLPLDIELVDADGRRRALGTVLGKPTILALIYYTCPAACSVIQGNLANTLNRVPARLGEEFQVISVSFDPEETPADAGRAKTNYTRIIKPVPEPAAWRFFTADAGAIQRLTDAVGFRYKKVGPHNFLHPNLVTVVAADGQIIRYLYGTDYLPFDVGMALSEALQGTPGVSIKKFLSYCFEYDPVKNRYAFKLFRVFGVITLAVIAGLLFFLLRKPGTDGRRSTEP